MQPAHSALLAAARRTAVHAALGLTVAVLVLVGAYRLLPDHVVRGDTGHLAVFVAAGAAALGVLVVLAVVSNLLSADLRRQTDAHAAALLESESRAAMLAMVATSARSMSTLDAEAVLAVVVRSALEMGFGAARVCLFDEPAASWMVAQEQGESAVLAPVQPIADGLPGLVWEGRTTAVVSASQPVASVDAELHDRGWHSAVASPVWSGGELAGTLVGLRRAPSVPSAAQVECLDMLGSQAGAALHNARLWAERRAFEARLSHQAFHDALTGLPNRSLFVDRLAHAVERAQRTGNMVAVLFMDLDRFKTVNDSLGHEAGDALLVAVARRLGSNLRPGDTLARYGGDEFTVLVEDVQATVGGTEVADRLLACLAEPFSVSSRELSVTASIGVAFAHGASATTDPLRDADLAMYRAKERGKARWEVFHPDMNARAVRRLEIEIELRRAVERSELFLEYQPLVDLHRDQITGVEALVRWQHPRRGVVLPDEFIPVAEETGLILPLGRWVLEEACRQGRRWLDEGVPPLHIAVNLSAQQFQRAELRAELIDLLERSGLPPSSLTLEITESAVMADAEAAVALMGDVSLLGVSLALDDFGQGYSSLSYLKRFPLDSVKVDKAFVDGVVANAEDRAIVRSVVALAQALGITTTAEGIETQEQLDCVRRLGVDVGQGFLLSRPVDASAVAALLRSRVR